MFPQHGAERTQPQRQLETRLEGITVTPKPETAVRRRALKRQGDKQQHRMTRTRQANANFVAYLSPALARRGLCLRIRCARAKNCEASCSCRRSSPALTADIRSKEQHRCYLHAKRNDRSMSPPPSSAAGTPAAPTLFVTKTTKPLHTSPNPKLSETPQNEALKHPPELYTRTPLSSQP